MVLGMVRRICTHIGVVNFVVKHKSYSVYSHYNKSSVVVRIHGANGTIEFHDIRECHIICVLDRVTTWEVASAGQPHVVAVQARQSGT